MPVPPEHLDPQPRTPDNDVMAMLRFNKEREAQRAINGPIEVVPKKSRRNRDFALIMLVGNLGILGIACALLGSDWRTLICTKPGMMIAVYSGSAVILLSAGTTWIMYQVMDDY